MSQLVRSLTGVGAVLALIGTLAAGCGRVNSPLEAGRAELMRPAPGLSAMSEDGDAPLLGGLKPLPKPTPTPPAPEPGGGGYEPDEVDHFHAKLRGYGYRGSRRALIGAVAAVTHSYPLGWDPRVNPAQHFDWWKRTLEGIANTPADYTQQAIFLAQHKFDVAYYVWVSKQNPSQMVNGRTTPLVDFNQEIPIVKGIQDEGLFVQISPRGTIVDYLRLPSEYLNDMNHVIPIPASLY